jgi:ATP-binding cassette subfamily D (ALD) protein 3
MARLFYHRPSFAILDECTSAVSDEVEDTIYATCRRLGITIFTVSHRPTLARHHDLVLRFEGHGNWSVEKIEQANKYKSNTNTNALIQNSSNTSTKLPSK